MNLIQEQKIRYKRRKHSTAFKAKVALAAAREDKALADRAFDHFMQTYEAEYRKATHWLAQDRHTLLAFYAFRAEHWVYLRTTNLIESTFGTIRHPTDQTECSVTRGTMLMFVCKLNMCVERRLRRTRGFEHLAKVITGVKFKDNIEVNVSSKSAA